MRTPICDELGIEFPIFAFTHCRDVAAAVSKAGGLGVLGAVGFSPEELRTELEWMKDNCDKPFGVDIVIPAKYEGMGNDDAEALAADLAGMVPDDHRRFAARLFEEAGVPDLTEEEQHAELLGWTKATAGPQVEIALEYDNMVMIANALGTPPADIVADIQGAGRKVAALCGSVKQALGHKEAGIDYVIAQGTEGGGHTGEVGSTVLWPEVIDALDGHPMLAAGGIGSGRQMAMAMAAGAQGVWTGSLWLTVEEADIPPGQMQSYLSAGSRDTVRSRSWTGKPCRMLKNDWTEAWEQDDTPEPLGMPMQMMACIDNVVRGHKYPEQAVNVNFNPCGQVIGRLDKMRRSSEVIMDMVEEYIETVERLSSGLRVDA